MRPILKFVSGLVALASLQANPAHAGGLAWDYSFQSIDGKPLPLAQFRGKVVMVVNTASLCGFTAQYAGLQKLYDSYEARGLVIVGVPSNDFGGQEPKAESEVKSFCEGAFGITFPLTAKYNVRGGERHPFYGWAADVLGAAQAPWWNFHKYLVGRDGKLVTAFGTRTEPMSADVVSAIDAELTKPAPTASAAP
jgi:glutathione peroxidase